MLEQHTENHFAGTTKRLFRIARDSALSANMFARHIYDCRLRLAWMRVERVPRVLSESSQGMKRFWKSACAISAKPGCLTVTAAGRRGAGGPESAGRNVGCRAGD